MRPLVAGPRGAPIFGGNADGDSVVAWTLADAVRARFVRFRPLAWQSHIAMRVEVLGEPLGLSLVAGLGCGGGAAVGAWGEDQPALPDAHLVASSSAEGFSSAQGRLLASSGAWCADSGDARPWLEVDLGAELPVTAVAVQGEASGFVTQFAVDFWREGSFGDGGGGGASGEWLPCADAAKPFAGPADSSSVVVHPLVSCIVSRRVRFRPLSWHLRPTLRVDVWVEARARGLALASPLAETSLTATSAAPGCGPWQALMPNAGWCPDGASPDEHLEIDLGAVASVQVFCVQHHLALG